MIYPSPCTDSQCTQSHQTYGGGNLHRGALYVQVLRTGNNDRHEVTMLSYKSIYFLTSEQKQRRDALIQQLVIAPMAEVQYSKRTSPIYFALTTSRHHFERLQKAACEEEINVVNDGPLIQAANEEGASLLERVYEICAGALVHNPIKAPQ